MARLVARNGELLDAALLYILEHVPFIDLI